METERTMLVPQWDEVLSKLETHNTFVRNYKRPTTPSGGVVFAIGTPRTGLVPVRGTPVLVGRDVRVDGITRRIVAEVQVATSDGMAWWTPQRGVDVFDPVALPAMPHGMAGVMGPSLIYADRTTSWALHEVGGETLITYLDGEVWFGRYSVNTECFLVNNAPMAPDSHIELELTQGDLIGEIAAASPTVITAGAPRLPPGTQPYDELLQYAEQLHIPMADLELNMPSDWPEFTVLADADPAILKTPLPWNLAMGAAAKAALGEGFHHQGRVLRIHATAMDDGTVEEIDFDEKNIVIKISGREERLPLAANVLVKVGDSVRKSQVIADYFPRDTVESMSVAAIRAELGTSVFEVTKAVLSMTGIVDDTQCLLDTRYLPEAGKDFIRQQDGHPQLFYDLRRSESIEGFHYIRAVGDIFKLSAGLLRVRSRSEERNTTPAEPVPLPKLRKQPKRNKRKGRGKATRPTNVAMVQ